MLLIAVAFYVDIHTYATPLNPDFVISFHWILGRHHVSIENPVLLLFYMVKADRCFL
jgi:hypothetical protein